MKNRLKAWLPTPQAIRENRWLRWMGPALHHPRLWHLSRKGIALGLALGIFFGFLVPLGQIPLAAGAAIALRANLPMAVASTLVTNPVTFAPVYYGAYRLGLVVMGQTAGGEARAHAFLDKAHQTPPPDLSLHQRFMRTLHHLTTVGKPLVVGLAIVATVSGLLVYFLISAIWTLRVRWVRSRRLRMRVQRAEATTR